jgi:asparagine synthase (glutamine-hydrolysing)
MCGIAGILTTRPDLDMSSPLSAMLCALRHRGPDDEGCEEVALPGGFRLGLAHTRLAIIDLSPAGHQPMQDPESGSWIVYNGETYNHQGVRQQLPGCRFRSTSDTETILKGWAERGEQILDSLRGMFAFALYDARRRQFWLVRDRLGIKPLYASAVGNGTWLFASELRALLASGLIPRKLHTEALESYLSYGAVAAPWTMIEKVTSLLPGECWQFDLRDPNRCLAPQRRHYWRPQFAARPVPIRRREEALERLRPVLLEATALRMVSDVPVGVFLSGGIDSSSVVSALASQGHKLHTFSIVFGEREFDESEHSRRIARHFGTEHTELFLSPNKILDEFGQALAAYDQPSIDGVNTYFIAQATRRAGVKVALSGLGGDELFGGYSYFRLLARLERPLSRLLAGVAYRCLRHLAPKSMRTVKLGAILHGNGSRLANYTVCRQVMARDRRATLLSRSTNGHGYSLPDEVHGQLADDAAESDVVNAQSLLELSLYLANMLLRDTDQMSMAHALEVREPLLDHVLVETVAELPGNLKLTPGRQNGSKALLVDALPTPLPDQVLRRPKMGFVFPWERWLRHELREQIEALFADEDALETAGLHRPGVQKLWNAFLASEPGIRYADVLCLAHLVHWVSKHLCSEPLTKLQSGSKEV